MVVAVKIKETSQSIEPVSIDLCSGWYWIPAALFLSGGFIVAMGGYNRPLFLVIHKAGWHISPVFWQLLTFCGGTLPVLALLLLLVRRYPQLLWNAVLAGMLAMAWSHGLKAWMNISRPPAVLGPDLLHVIGPRLKHGSFPSGHATTAFTIAGLVALRVEKCWWRLCLLAVATLVGMSRIMVGVHWPVDVLAGACGGWLSAGAGLWLSGRWTAGLKLRRVLIILFILCGVALLFFDSRYPAARWLAVFLALLTVPAGLLALGATWREEF
jgi:membrane-associated phospholipid phosphatase